jgi:hypothetical protein
MDYIHSITRTCVLTSLSFCAFSRLEAPQPPIRRNQYGEYYDPHRQEVQPSRPSSQQSAYQPYEWYRTEQEPQSAASISYQPPPPVITEQPRSSIGPQHFQPFDRAYPKTLESLAEKVHTFYTGPRAPRQPNGRPRIPRTGSDHRISLSRTGEPQWYGSMPRQRPGTDFRTSGLPPSARYPAGKMANFFCFQVYVNRFMLIALEMVKSSYEFITHCANIE